MTSPSSMSAAERSTPQAPSGAPPRTGVLITVLAALTAVAPLATDMYVPAFPEMTTALNATSSGVQLSMTAFLLGLVIGQLLIGPLSDGHGRRRLLLGGSALFTVFSLACAVAPNAQVLTAARLLEGVAGAAGMVISRAVLTDWYRGADAARHFSVLSMILGVAPVAAPVIGSVIATAASWRAVFVVLALFGLLLLLTVWRWVPESLPTERRHPGGIPAAFRTMARLTRNRTFMGYVLVLSCASAALFAYISGSPFVFQDIYGASATGYSLIFAVNAVALLVASGLLGVLSRRMHMNTLLSIGVGLSVLATAVQAVIDLTVGGSLVTTWICLFVTMFGLGLTITSTYTLGQAVAKHAAGGASAMLGGGQFLLGAAVSPLVGAFGESSPTPMALIMFIAFLCAGAMLLLLARPWQRQGEHRATF
ncbi:multidrug effflux MFS transporter [Streptomyces justiciae]|uniref:multidrug effflux MFS transporter n=1 Tax=Streptomyces justiciae TaxID=2780140 RepID=UPI002117363F|nr:multidrug effflux MFS transporter [Streptomyces justiciae]MCW8379740.1 multidrug effflux MFS transporter [Streptomyces justiciae]